MVKICALESSGSAKRSYKTQGITLSLAVVRDLRCKLIPTRTYSTVSIKTVTEVFLFGSDSTSR